MSSTFEDSKYVILINDDNTMTVTQKRRIVQRSKLVDDLWFIVNPEYNGYSLTGFTVLLEYLLPVSRKYKTEILRMSNDTYNGYLKFTLPLDTMITSEAGSVDMMLSFIAVEMDEYGNSVQRVRKVSGTKIDIVPIAAWSDIIPDEALSAIDQRIIKTDAQLKALSDFSETLYMTKADDLNYDEVNNELQLMSGGKEIGKRVTINTTTASVKDGVPVVDFGSMSGVIPAPDEDDDDIVEF